MRRLLLPLLSVACASNPGSSGNTPDPAGTATTNPTTSASATASPVAGKKAVPCPSDDEAACKAACDANDLESCVRLGSIWSFGNANVKADLSKAREVQEKACAGGVAKACYYAGASFELRSKEVARGKELRAKGVAGMKAACEADDAESCSIYADLHLTGEGAPKDPAKEEMLRARANFLYGKACDQGDGAGCFMFGGSLVDTKRDAEAVQALTKGCELSDAGSCSLLAGCYDEGVGTKADPAKAAQLFAKGCKLGNEAACSRVGK